MKVFSLKKMSSVTFNSFHFGETYLVRTDEEGRGRKRRERKRDGKEGKRGKRAGENEII